MKYYLFKPGTLTGPITEDQLEALKKNKKILDYHWIIDSETEAWQGICEMPTDNPFKASKKNITNRTLSAAFVIAKNAYTGEICTMNSFGVEVLIKGLKKPLRGFSEKKSILLNLCDETQATFVNGKGFIQAQELTDQGLQIRFNWDQQEVTL